jgi:hypothetical protein
LHEAVAAATGDWVSHGAGTIIWDTITQTAHDLLEAYAKIGNYAQQQITFGKRNTPEFHAHPTPGDYGAAQNSVCEHLMGHLFGQPLNLIVIAHEDWSESKNSGEVVGGPSTVGQATIKSLPGRFDTVIRCEAKRRQEPGKPPVATYIAHTQPHGSWIAGVRNPGVNLPDIILAEDPRHFWQEYDKLVS